jgi:hypothetical protein
VVVDAISHHDLLIVITMWACLQLITIIIMGVRVVRRVRTESRRLAIVVSNLIIHESQKIRRQRS